MAWKTAHSSLSTTPLRSNKPQNDRPDEEIKKSIYKDFLTKMKYHKPDVCSTNEVLEAWMCDEMHAQKIQCPELEEKIHLAASLIELAFHECTLSEKKIIALINWYVIYMDDISNTDDRPCVEFAHRLLRGQPQLDPVLDSLASTLLSLFDYYDTPVANNILMSVLELISATFIESKMANNKFSVPSGGTHFPSFLRDRTGLGVAFALLPFPKSLGLNAMDYMGALPDMNFWICYTNDLLSFMTLQLRCFALSDYNFSYHKEELGGENNNYVGNRAFAEGKTPLQVLAELEQELSEARDAIYTAPAPNPAAVRAWRIFELGGTAWHLEQKRYKLKDMAL